jgi:hypothetical protein
MALSDDEKRVLADIETALEHDSPRLAKRLGRSASPQHAPRPATVLGLGYAALGTTLMLTGLFAGKNGPWLVVVIGYVTVVLGLSVALSGWFWAERQTDR